MGSGKLANEGFLSKAPTHVVEGCARRAEELKVLRDKARGRSRSTGISWLAGMIFAD